MRSLATASLLAVALTLGACADRSSEDATAVDRDGTGAGGDVIAPEPGAAPVSPSVPDAIEDGNGTDPIFDVESSAPDIIEDNGGTDPIFDVDSSAPDVIEDNGGTDPIFDVDSSAPDVIEDDGGTDPIVDVDSSPPDVIEGDGDTDPIFATPSDPASEAPDGVEAVAPTFPGRPDAARLYAAMGRVLGNTLLDLNRALAEGTPLTEQQQECLGAFDPAFGEPLLALDCERALATEPFVVYVGRGAFAATDACIAGLATGDADECVLELADMTARTKFVQTPPARRPLPVDGSGIVMRHGVDFGVFEIGDDDDPIGPDFGCAYDIASGTRLPTSRGDCDRLVRAAADFMDALIAEASPVSASGIR